MISIEPRNKLIKKIDYFGVTLQNSQMLISRDFFLILTTQSQLEAVLLWGPRQVGKTTLLDQLPLKSTLLLDDLRLRQQAQSDPAFTLDHLELPCLIDEAQHAPSLFSEIKLRIDQLRREDLKREKKTTANTPLYYLTGSNKTYLDKNVKESLAGRCHLYILHGLSVKELVQHFKDKVSIKQILFQGGLPQLYKSESTSTVQFLNDYVLSFVEKDIALSAGISKLAEFQTLLRLLAAHTGHFLNFHELAKISGVDQKTIQSWIQILEQNAIIKLVPTYFSNLSKRITKMKKLYFYDTGICARLQGHQNKDQLWNSIQIGGLFETLVFSEIMKTKDNFLQDWDLYTWRTKEKKEVDFILKSGDQVLFIEVKLGIHNVFDFQIDNEAQKVFAPYQCKKIIVNAGDKPFAVSKQTECIPITQLGSFLLNVWK